MLPTTEPAVVRTDPANTSPSKAVCWAVAADAVALTHALFVGFVVWAELLVLFGSLLGWDWVRNLPFRGVHLGLVVFVGVQDVLGRVCPLTVWENQFRARAGQATSGKPFIGRLVHRLLACHLSERTQRTIRLTFACVVLATFLLLPPHWTIG
jgi:hypothetical protein